MAEGGLSDRFFYAADLPERLGGEAGGIPSVYFAWKEAGNDWSPLSFRDLTLREDWRSASNPGTLRWYYQRLTLMQQGEAAYENDEGLWLTDGSCYTGDFLETEDGRALTNFTGPYPDGEIHH